MKTMSIDVIERIYAGWLAKIIGIRLGAPIEGWSYKQIRDIYGAPDGYPVDYREFAADDDSNGPLFFLRALGDSGRGEHMTSQDVADALLNYAPFEHGFFWWGGYGVSTEHTAYLNLRNGIPAPRSGSIEQNGSTTAEQIGGQIFIDTWGLVTPGNPDLAAKLAERAARVTHGGNGVYGGIFVAVCISYAFVEHDIKKIIKKGLSYIPEECEYAGVVRAVMAYHEKHPQSWEDCYDFVFQNYGYDKYPGVCHIIPNIAVMILGMLYGNGDFSDTLNIINRCGWDTDCNVGNVAVIMGVREGLDAIDYNKWRKPVNDLLICSSVVGSLNILDVPYGASYIVKLAAKLSGKKIPSPYKEIIENRIDSCHFEYPGSTHAIRVRTEYLHNSEIYPQLEYNILNTNESAATGSRSLKVICNRIQPGENILIYRKTYYRPSDFHDSRYDPSFSPLIYPGQTIHGSAMLPEYGEDAGISLYVRDSRSGEIWSGETVFPKKGEWINLSYKIPRMEGALLDEMGFCVHVAGERDGGRSIPVLIDDLYADGNPSYILRAEKEEEEIWTLVHREITQFTRTKGLLYLENNQIHLSCGDFGEIYTGRHDWKDYSAEFTVTPITGWNHMVNIRVQGASRSYAAGFTADRKAALLKNCNGYRILTECSYDWTIGQEYRICISVVRNKIRVTIDGVDIMEYTDDDQPYIEGAIGVSVMNGSHISCSRIEVS